MTTTKERTGDRRSALVKPEYMLAVNPNGRYVKVRLAKNIGNPVFVRIEGKWRMRPSAEEAGWKRLEELHSKAEQAKIEAYFRHDEEHNGQVAKLPEKHIPKKVLEMRKATARLPEFDFDRKEPTAG